MISIVLTLLGFALAAGLAAETSPIVDVNAGALPEDAAMSAKQDWFWKGGFGGGYTTVGAGGSLGGEGVGSGTTIYFTSFFTETLSGPVTTEYFTLPGFTTTVFFTPSVATAEPTDVTSFTTIPITTTITQS